MRSRDVSCFVEADDRLLRRKRSGRKAVEIHNSTRPGGIRVSYSESPQVPQADYLEECFSLLSPFPPDIPFVAPED